MRASLVGAVALGATLTLVGAPAPATVRPVPQDGDYRTDRARFPRNDRVQATYLSQRGTP